MPLRFPVIFSYLFLIGLPLKQGPAKRSVFYMNKSQFHSGDIVDVLFPDNGILKNCRVISVSFPITGSPRYHVEVPFSYIPNFIMEDDKAVPGKARIHSLKEWHLRDAQNGISDRYEGRMLPDTADEDGPLPTTTSDWNAWINARSHNVPQSDTFAEWRRRGEDFQTAFEVGYTRGFEDGADAVFKKAGTVML